MPLKDTLDDVAYTCVLVSYHRLSPQFQFSLSAATLVYLSQWRKLFTKLRSVHRILLDAPAPRFPEVWAGRSKGVHEK